MRNLDIAVLRSFVAVAQTGGVTRAAHLLNLTQSAVSMQLRRLEESLDLQVLERSGRGVALTAAGEQLLGYARRMVEMNDEAFRRLTHREFEGEIALGVPIDIVYPVIPEVLRRFAAGFPRVKVQLLSLYTDMLKDMLAHGECDLILTTESEVGPGGEVLREVPLRWVGAPGGAAWRQRPLRLAYCRHCTFRRGDIAKLDAAGIPWEMAVESDSDRTIEATVSADLGVTSMLEGTEPRHLECIVTGGALPDLGVQKIALYGRATGLPPVAESLKDLIREGYRGL
jgi:DNA-binding transcriptional LysR family regulator